MNKITTGNPPVFPCWLWPSFHKAWVHYAEAPYNHVGDMYQTKCFPYWHPDQPTSPEEVPEAVTTQDAGQVGNLAREFMQLYRNRSLDDAADPAKIVKELIYAHLK